MLRFLTNPWIRFSVFLAILTAGIAYAVGSWEAFQQSRTGLTAATAPSGSSPRGAWPLSSPLDAVNPGKGHPEAGGQVPSPAPAGGVSTPAAQPGQSGDFFAEFRLNRERARGQELELLQVVLGNPAVAEAVRRDAETRFLRLGRIGGLEAELENLLRARGFADALVSVSDHSAHVVVKGNALTPGQLAAVADLVRVTTGVKGEAVQVVTRER